MPSPVDAPRATHGSIPARAGIGLRAQHHIDVIEQRPDVGWLEVHSENYFGNGGAPLEHLLRARELYPLSLHGVGLSIGSADPLDVEHLRKLKRLIDRIQPSLVSEHICWGAIGGRHLNDLLPLPYTQEALQLLTDRVHQVQDFLGRSILLENVSSYLEFSGAQMTEAEFVSELARRSGCGLLIDVNNIYVSSRNHGFDAQHYLASIPATSVHEIHLAGFSINHYQDREILIDTHSTHVSEDVWQLYRCALDLYGPKPTLIEWDTDIPDLSVLAREASLAERELRAVHGLAA
jgi:uncharacterized protein (UPF0276 family)